MQVSKTVARHSGSSFLFVALHLTPTAGLQDTIGVRHAIEFFRGRQKTSKKKRDTLKWMAYLLKLSQGFIYPCYVLLRSITRNTHLLAFAEVFWRVNPSTSATPLNVTNDETARTCRLELFRCAALFEVRGLRVWV